MKWVMRMLGKVKKDRHGFTLIELMIVLIIVAILAVAAVPTYTYFVKRAYESEASASLGAVKTAEIVYHAEHGGFATDVDGDADVWDDLGMTSADFAQNKWFTYGCFALTHTSGAFTAYADGSKTTTAPAKVGTIYKKLTNTSDVLASTAAEIAADSVYYVP